MDYCKIYNKEEPEIEAKKILQESKKEAESIVLNAKSQVSSIMNKARNEGYENGYKEGYEAGQKELQRANLEAKEILRQMLEEKYNLLSGLEPKIAELCLSIASKIIYRQIQLDNSNFLSIISNALKKAQGSERAKILVGDSQYDNLIESKSYLLSTIKTLKSLEIVKDKLLSDTDCIIETECGLIDVGVETQIDSIKKIFDLKATV